jgi:site-specific recombinase XerD
MVDCGRDLGEKFREERLNEGASPATVNKELSALSRIFSVLIEHQLLENNPVHLVKRSVKSPENVRFTSAMPISSG